MDASQDGGGGQGGKTDHAYQPKRRRTDNTSQPGSAADSAEATSQGGSQTTGMSKPSSERGKSRCQPANLLPVYASLVEEKQRRAIKQIALGNTLNIQFKERLYGDLIDFLVDKVDTDSYKLRLGNPDDPVIIDLFEAAAKVFGVNNEGKKFDISAFGSGKKSKKRGRDLKPDCSMNVKAFIPVLKNSRNLRKKTCKVYMYSALAYLLATNSSLDIDLRFSKIVEDVDNIKTWNLVDLIVKLLVKGIKDVRNKTATYLIGSPFLLVVIFLDMINHPDLKMDGNDASEVFPRMNHVRDCHLKWIKKMKSQWSTLNIKPLSGSYYCKDVPYKWDTNYDWGNDCVDEWDKEKDDDRSHLTGDLTEDCSEKNSEVDTHKNGESSKNSIFMQQSEEASCLGERFKEALDCIRDNGLAIPSAVKKITEEHAPNLPKEAISPLCEALTSYVLSRNTEAEKKLQALGERMFKYCGLVRSINKDTVNCEGQARKNKPKVPRPFPAGYKYPADGSCDEALDLGCVDLKSLSEDISDGIMELRIKHLKGVFAPLNLNSQIENESFICHTFYWPKIVDRYFDDVKNWLNVALEEKSIDDIKFFFLPVHKKPHWSLVIIHRPEGGASTTSTIFHMDSLASEDKPLHPTAWVFEIAERFAINVLDINADQIRKEVLQVPHQGPTSDCGFFVLYNIERVLAEVSDAAAFPLEQINSSWYDPKEASAMRKDTFRLIELHKMKYRQPVGNCEVCKGGHESLVKRFEHAFSS